MIPTVVKFRGGTYRLASTVTPQQLQDLGLTPEQAAAVVTEISHAYRPRAVDAVLDRVNELLDAHGVEALRVPDAYINDFYLDSVGLYINMGDPYIATLVYDTETREFHVMGYGDFLEYLEFRHPEYRPKG